MNDENAYSNLSYLKSIFSTSDEDGFLKNYQRLADFFPALIYVYDADKKRIGYFNKKFSELLGFTQDDFISFGESWNDLVFKEDADKFNENLQKFHELKDDEHYTFDNRFNRKQGDWKYFRTLGTVLRRNNDGKPVAALFVAQDITETLANSEELKKAKDLIRETELLHEYGIYNYDKAADKMTWSEGMYDIFEIEKKDAENISLGYLLSFIDDDDKEDVRKQMKDKLLQGADFNHSFSVITAKGNHKFCINRAKVIHDEHNNGIKIIGSIRDVTKEILAERELQRNIKDLSRSNKELEEFAYAASHDLQEPLRKITIFANRLQEKFYEQLGTDGKIYLDRINASARNMHMLIESLLDISRTTRTTQHYQLTDLDQVFAIVKGEFELKIEEDEATIITNGLPAIEAIASQMVQLFNNLLSNALKFKSTDRKPVITVTADKLSKEDKAKLLLPEKDFYLLCFEDNGIGFEQEYAEKVFQIFQRLHGKAEYPGSGIGLSICKKIIDKHNGLIWAESEAGKGTRFYIVLPENQE
jgi:PAS domain S-box-containing protein